MNNTTNSPKRKREILPTPPISSPLKSCLSPSSPEHSCSNNPALIIPLEDEVQGSPRTKVAHNFQSLHLGSGGTVSKFDLVKGYEIEDRMDIQRDENIGRKRVKVLEGEDREIPETPTAAFTISVRREGAIDLATQELPSKFESQNNQDPVVFQGSGDVVKGTASNMNSPFINRLCDSKPRTKKRMGTPPLSGSGNMSLDEGSTSVVDLDRAALTWHDDEITGHNPTDPDDDGEGINGIGFKPTAAIAYARTAKRKQQMEEYKNREAKEARAKRSERRRGLERSQARSREEAAETARRVRFLEGEAKSAISTS